MEYLVSAQAMRSLDQQTIDDLAIPARVLMEVAGRAVADLCRTHTNSTQRILVLCGPGNNGGDGLVTARLLENAGYRVQVLLYAEPHELKGDVANVLLPLQRSKRVPILEVISNDSFAQALRHIEHSDVIIDALFGTGLTRAPEGFAKQSILAVNQAKKYCISVDIPSGIDATTGQILDVAVQAKHTVTFGFAKQGHWLFPGAAHCGTLHVRDIGIPHHLIHTVAPRSIGLRAADIPTLLPARPADCHKGHFGHVAVLAGSPTMPGAALLTLQGALRSGVGLVRWITHPLTSQHAQLPADVLLHFPDETTPSHLQALYPATALVVGPGWSQTPAKQELIGELIQTNIPLCLDADALHMLSGTLRPNIVLTPHPKEMSHLMGTTVSEIQQNRIAAAEALAQHTQATVLLKGAATIIASPQHSTYVMGEHTPALATAGSGDVLAGLIGGLLAQGFSAHAAAALGALVHACAGQYAAKNKSIAATTATDIADAITHVWLEWQR